MPSADHVQRLLPLVREYGRLEKKRTQVSVTPAEYERWAELRKTLEKSFPQGDRPAGGERRQNLRLPTRMAVEFSTQGELESALIRNISRGGLFIATQVAAVVGSKITLLIRVGADGETVELPAEVASTGVTDERGQVGMGCKFAQLSSEQQQIVEEMFATALDAEG
jgi:uncharacterized protein (TIGR02266 family)